MNVEVKDTRLNRVPVLGHLFCSSKSANLSSSPPLLYILLLLYVLFSADCNSFELQIELFLCFHEIHQGRRIYQSVQSCIDVGYQRHDYWVTWEVLLVNCAVLCLGGTRVTGGQGLDLTVSGTWMTGNENRLLTKLPM